MVTPARPRRIVIAPDSFKGTIGAREAARAIAEGWRSVRGDDDVVLRPMADGGEGTLDAFEEALPGARRMPVTVTGPLGVPHASSWLLASDPAADAAGATLAVVELAATVGIELIAADRLRPLDASSRGFGEAIRAALDRGAQRLVLAIGSSASSDGGAGMLQALGARVLDARGEQISPGARGLAEVAAVDLADLVPPPPGGVVLTDVVSPLLGPDGAAAVFGPQKGADSADVARIETALTRWAGLVDADPMTPGAGAAGGVGFALRAWGAELASGAQKVADLVGLDAAVAEADLVITGEGCYDHQSAQGKAPSVVADAARRAGAAVAIVAGAIDAEPARGKVAVSLSRLAGGSAAAMADPARWLRHAGAQLAHDLAGPDAGAAISRASTRGQ